MKLKIFLLSFCSAAFCFSVIPETVRVFTPLAASSAMTCNFDLLLHEGGDHKGHAIANHVAKSDSFLVQRLANDPDLEGASTYASVQQAQSLTNSTLCDDQTRLDTLLKAPDKTSVTFKKTFSKPTGTLMKADKTKKDVYGVVVVAQKKSTFSDKLVIITSYPADF
jgi:Bacterial CdiA-CT RNAse A domain